MTLLLLSSRVLIKIIIIIWPLSTKHLTSQALGQADAIDWFGTAQFGVFWQFLGSDLVIPVIGI